MPQEVSVNVKKALFTTGIQSEEALKFLHYAISNDSFGNPISTITQQVYDNPGNPRAFMRLYGLLDADGFDKGYIFTKGAHGIYLRLQSLIDSLPEIIFKERQKLGLEEDEKYRILNIGCAYALDTIHAIHENPLLQRIVKVICIDSDIDSIQMASCLAENLGISQ